MKIISIKLPDGLHRKLEDTAKRRQTTKSELVRMALEKFLIVEKPKPRPGSALELAGDLVGCARGPRDLSTNPKYIEGFGQ
jgi:hypothetical protein